MAYKKLGFSLLFLVAYLVTNEAQHSSFIGQKAPPLKIEEWLKGAPLSLFEKNKIYVIDFWALWCGPCLTGIPHLNELQKKYKDQVKIIGITNEDKWGNTKEKVIEFIAKNEIDYHLVWAPPSKSGNTQGIFFHDWLRKAKTSNMPQAIIVDQNGKVAFIGEPQTLDLILSQLINNDYNLDSAIQSHIARMQADSLLETLKNDFKQNKLLKAYSTAHSIFQLQELINPRIYSRLSGIINKNAPTGQQWDTLSIESAKKAIVLSNFQESGYLDTLSDSFSKAGMTFEAVLTESLATKLSTGAMQTEQLKKLKNYLKELKKI